MDQTAAFVAGEYDRHLISRNKVQMIRHGSNKFYFDTSGFVQEILLYDALNKPRVTYKFEYNSYGDRIAEDVFDFGLNKGFKGIYFKTYENSRLIRDSSEGTCHNFFYDDNDHLKKIIWRWLKVGNKRIIQFTYDSVGRPNRIIDRQYQDYKDTVGKLLSDRIVYYNNKGKPVREEESVNWDSNTYPLNILNYGSIMYKYDQLDKLVEVVRSKGPSQKVKYNDKGLIEVIETSGQYNNGEKFVWKWKYDYSYRK
jgi:hypothetical protein